MPARTAATPVAAAAHHTLLDRIAGDAALLDREARVCALTELQSLRGWQDAREAALLGVCYTENDDVNSGARDITQLVQQQTGVSYGEAKRGACRAKWLPEMPVAATSLASGTLGTGHTDELCALAERLDPGQRPALFASEADLVSELEGLTPFGARKRLQAFETELATGDGQSKLQTQQAANSLRLFSKRDGTTGVDAQLDPLSAEYLRTALDHKVTELWRQETSTRDVMDPPSEVMSNQRRRAEALVALVRQGHAAGAGSRGHAEILVHIDYKTLIGDLTAAGICRLGNGTPIPADTVRRLACEAGIIPLVLGSESIALDVGRNSRTATATQKAAARAIYDTCSIDGCDVGFDHCQMHHIWWWRHNGPTDLNNLIPLCSKHHHLVHDHGWHMWPDNNRVATLHKTPQPGTPDFQGLTRPETTGASDGPKNMTDRTTMGSQRPQPSNHESDRSKPYNTREPTPEPVSNRSCRDTDPFPITIPNTDPGIDSSPRPQDAPTPMRC